MSAFKIVKTMNKEDIPNYRSDRVTASADFDQSDRRHLYHNLLIKVDGSIVCSQQWYEDDNFSNCSEEEPNSADMWCAWIKSMGLNPEHYR